MSEMQSDILWNSCNVCDIEWMDDKGEGGCGSAPISLIVKVQGLKGVTCTSCSQGVVQVQCVEDALVQHVLPSRYGGALPFSW